MTAKKLYPDDFTNQRRLAWIRSKCQAQYRQEQWNLSFDEFCAIWSTPELFVQRGRGRNDLVLVRYHNNQAWSLANCRIITRHNQLKILSAIKTRRDYNEYLKDPIWQPNCLVG